LNEKKRASQIDIGAPSFIYLMFCEDLSFRKMC
jgi:hypothetical protein